MRILNGDSVMEIAEKMLPENSKNIEKLVKILSRKDPSSIIKNSAFYKIKSEDEIFDLYLDGESKQVSLNEAEQNKKKLIDFTTPMNCSYKKIIDNFDEFIKEKKMESPEATVNVLSQCIIIQDKDKQSFYAYKGEDIKEAEVLEKEKVNVQFKEEKSLAVIPKNKGIFTKIFNFLNLKQSPVIASENFEYMNQNDARENFLNSLNPIMYNLEENNTIVSGKDKSKENEMDDVER